MNSPSSYLTIQYSDFRVKPILEKKSIKTKLGRFPQLILDHEYDILPTDLSKTSKNQLNKKVKEGYQNLS